MAEIEAEKPTSRWEEDTQQVKETLAAEEKEKQREKNLFIVTLVVLCFICSWLGFSIGRAVYKTW